MKNQPDYFDSQASASAQLHIPLSDIRNAKACGCVAFRSGRVYGKELLAWLKKEAEARPFSEGAHDHLPEDWEERLGMIFEVGEFLDHALYSRKIGAADYRRIGDKTIPLLVQLAKAWDAGIDAPGYLGRWMELRRRSMASEKPKR